MSQLEDLAGRRREGGFSAREMIRHDSDVAACYLCRKYHPLRGNNAAQDYADFAFRHPAESGHVLVRLTPDYLRRAVLRAQKRRQLRRDSVLNFTHNSSVLEAFQGADQSVDLTAFGIASSATAGWSSHYVDNSSNLYLDYLAYVKFASVATAPANNKAFYVFGATAINTADLPCSGAGSGNTVPNSSSTSAVLTFPSISTPLPCLFPLVRVLPYPVTTVANTHPLFSSARAFGGWIGLYLWWPFLNFSGMTINVTGTAWKYRGVYNTVA